MKLELLAPAKNLETAVAAINFGADAVYMGGPSFGARSQAGNSVADIAAAVRHAHIYGAKIYVTVNTLLHDGELPEAVTLIRQLYDIGADAVIVQDAGLLAADLPPIALHASTQMHNNTPKKVRFLEQIGVKRAVLPREFSLADIRHIRENTTSIELESFVHGALCVSYSGQCYLSYAVGGRSANRGECAQPCRKAYALLDENGKELAKNKYLLSLKDLCLADYLEQMADAGVMSFKIEGRLKNIQYVKNVVAFYRQKLDALLERRRDFTQASDGRVYFDFTPDLAKTFNRHYTGYFIQKRQHNITQFETPKAMGEAVGEVSGFKSGMVQIKNVADLHPGDGLCWLEAGGLRGAQVNKVSGAGAELQGVDNIRPGTKLFRNYDHRFAKALDNSKTRRKIPLDISLTWNGDNMQIAASYRDGLSVFFTGRGEFEAAADQTKGREALRKAFAKLGDTPFELRKFDIKGETPFLPVSEVNACRRSLAESLLVERLKENEPRAVKLNPAGVEYPATSLDFKANAINQNARQFYEEHGAVVTESGAETGLDLSGRTVMTTKHCLRYSFGQCPRHNQNVKTGDWVLIDDKGYKYKLRFNCADCLMEIIL